MTGFRCPFCGQFMSISRSTAKKYYITFDAVYSEATIEPCLCIEMYYCPNGKCRKETVIAYGKKGYIDDKKILIYPENNSIQFPIYVPEAVRADYEEACAVLNKSPKASATLSRRCLQGMIRDFWGISKGRLVDEIKELKGKIPAAQWNAIDALRNIGNIGAHMEKDVNLIIDVEPEEAESLLKLIELLIEKWYISRHDEEELCNSIVKAAASKKVAKSPGSP